MNSIFRIAAAAIVVLAAVSLLTHNSTGVPVGTTTTAPARHYYLTKSTFTGNQALTACATGYRFASFAEISNPSDVAYNKTLGRNVADSGSGRPSLAYGWIRTGYPANSNSSDPSIPTNCNVWTSGNSTDSGQVVVFGPVFGRNSTAVPTVAFVNTAHCDSAGANIGVWCVQN